MARSASVPLTGRHHATRAGRRRSKGGLKGADIYHLAAVYDLEAPERTTSGRTSTARRNVVAARRRASARRIHHMSSIAVAGGRWKGKFTEEMFAEGQVLDHPYYRTKYEAERLVRESGVPFRIYRPGLVIGSSETGEADRIDGPYYAFKLIQRLRNALPSWVPLIGLEGGQINIVPVDFVARAMDAIAHQAGLDGQTFHLTDPDAAQPRRRDQRVLPRSPRAAVHAARRLPSRGDAAEGDDGDAAALARSRRRSSAGCSRACASRRRRCSTCRAAPDSPCDNAQAALEGTGIACPPLHTYAWKVWDYWERRLDPEALDRAQPPRGARRTASSWSPARRAESGAPRRRCSPVTAREVVLVSRTKEKLEELKRGDRIGGRPRARPSRPTSPTSTRASG